MANRNLFREAFHIGRILQMMTSWNLSNSKIYWVRKWKNKANSHKMWNKKRNTLTIGSMFRSMSSKDFIKLKMIFQQIITWIKSWKFKTSVKKTLTWLKFLDLVKKRFQYNQIWRKELIIIIDLKILCVTWIRVQTINRELKKQLKDEILHRI